MDTITGITPSIILIRSCLLLAAAASTVAATISFSAHEKITARQTLSKQTIEKTSAPPSENQRMFRAEMADLAARHAALLAAEPIDSRGWAWLSYLYLISHNDRPAALAALRMSQKVTPYHRAIMISRAFAFYDLRTLHTPEDQETMTREWQYAYKSSPHYFMQRLVQNPAPVADIDAALQKGDTETYAHWVRSAQARKVLKKD